MEDAPRISVVTCDQTTTITICNGDLPLGAYMKDINLNGFGHGNCWGHSLKALSCENSNYAIYVLHPTHIELGHMALRRMIKVAHDTCATMVFCDYYFRMSDGSLAKHPTIDYQEGSLRDDFDFGPLVLINEYALNKACFEIYKDLKELVFSGFYAVRLALSRIGKIVHIPEYLYTCDAIDSRSSGERIFDYLREDEAEKQREMEAVCTWHLTKIGAFLPPEQYTEVDLNQGDFPVECSVIIPVLNRVNVIRDAIKSVLAQETSFKFNLIVIDNHSTDGTTDAIDEFADDPRLIHMIPERNDLGIGGCWNLAVYDERCGRFAIGLDSDDLFATPYALETMVTKFYKENAAMVVGSYMIVDYNLQEVPPYIITHREWTMENGRNNLLRVNGIGGPRAFFTPIYRATCLPCSSYGEDYGMGLMLSRHYRVGRVWDMMTLARRGDDNTDSHLTIEQENANNLYKDLLRTWEVQARIALTQGKNEYSKFAEYIQNLLPIDSTQLSTQQKTKPFSWAPNKYPRPEIIEKDSIEERVINLLKEQCDNENLRIEFSSSFSHDLGFNELDLVELIIAAENEFNITIDNLETTYIFDLGDFISCIKYNVEHREKNNNNNI